MTTVTAKNRLKQLASRIDALSLRERILVFGTTIAVVASIWYLGAIEPLAQTAGTDQKEIGELSARIDSANQTLEMQVLQLAGAGDDGRAQLQGIYDRIDRLNEQIGDFAEELIDPAEMARVLESLLDEQSDLRLISMRNLDAERLVLGEEPAAGLLFSHGLEIKFEGSYRACIEYLESIEALPWRLYWQVLELEAADYPTNEIRLVVGTLSMDEEWIGA